jgi:hypothetical protein
MSFSTILHKRSSIAGVVPSLTSLSAGEIAINTADGKFFTKTGANEVKTFLNSDQLPFSLDQSLSSVNYQYGENGVSGVLSVVLGGVNNSISGAGSTVVNGSDNTIDGDYAFIGNGSNNIIDVEGDFGAIVGGQNNTLSHPESFILGSNITSHLSGFTYVNNLSSLGKIFVNGAEITGGAGSGADTEVRSLTANWETGYQFSTKFSQTSSTFATNTYADSTFVKLSGGVMTGTFEISSSNVSSVLYVASNGKVGINTESPSHDLTVNGSVSSNGIIYTSGDVELTDSTKGIILRSPNNSRWRVTITDSGTLSTVAL